MRKEYEHEGKETSRERTCLVIMPLADIIRDVIRKAIEAGGSSLRDHRQADGNLGYFQHQFKVYDREDEVCSKPGCGGTISRIVQSGRSSFYCPKCQK